MDARPHSWQSGTIIRNMTEPVRKRKRTRPSSRKFRRRFMLTGVLCVVVLCLIPVVHYYGWFSKSAEVLDNVPPLQDADLLVSDAVFVGVGPARHIEGSIRNRTANPYTDVRIVFTTRRADGAQLTPTVATVPAIGPSATVRFQSGPVPADTSRYYVRDITGNSR